MKIYLLLFLVFPFQVSANDVLAPFVITQEEIKYIYDGDTFYIKCQEGLKCKDGKLGIRAKDLDTPELKGKCDKEIRLARKAKRFVVAMIRDAKRIEIHPYRKQPYDRFDRLLAFVKLDNQDWLESVLDANLGRRWTGRRESWCN